MREITLFVNAVIPTLMGF